MTNTASPAAIGRYVIQSRIGAGSFGTVYRAQDPVLKRPVAIKVPLLNLEPEDLKSVVDGFYHEAEIAAQFVHPNIVTIYDLGSNALDTREGQAEQHLHYLVMEHVAGVSLAQYLEQGGALELDETVDIIYACCKALDYIHFNGIIHRDIKPGNILYHPSSSVVKITDFSISSIISDPTPPAGGTLMYMAPETFSDDHRGTEVTDLFSLGMVMYELLAGSSAFSANSPTAVAYSILNMTPQPLSELRGDLPGGIDAFMEKALHKERSGRFPTALAFAEALLALVQRAPSALEVPDRRQETEAGGLNVTDVGQYLNFRKESWFKDFSPEQISEVVSVGEILEFQDRDSIVREGEVGDAFFTILEGKVDVLVKGQRVNTMGKGECFGELGVASGKRQRTATIIADGPLRLLAIRFDLLGGVSAGTRATLYKAFFEQTIERLTDRSRELAEYKATYTSGKQ